MSKAGPKHKRVLAIDLGTRGFGYAVMEGPHKLIDWGVREIRRNKTTVTLAKARQLIDRYQPEVFVLEDYSSQGDRRPDRVRTLANRLREPALDAGIRTQSFARSKVKGAFVASEAVSRYEIASLLAKWFPELFSRLPPKRKPWMPEHPQMGVFDAVALALTYYFFER